MQRAHHQIEQERRFPLLGGSIEIVLYDVDPGVAAILFEEIYQEGLRLQSIFNFFDPQSELSLLNQQRIRTVSAELLEVLTVALRYCRETGGRYDISKGREILLRKRRRQQPRAAPTSNYTANYTAISFHGNTVRLQHPSVCIDLGSIAKGYIVDKLLEFISQQGILSAFIDARGDMRITGQHLEIVEIQHPRKKGGFQALLLENKAVATSGDYSQYYGTPETSHLVGTVYASSVTVLADTLMEADVLATCASLLPLEEARALIENHTAAALIVDKQGGIHETTQFPRYTLTEEPRFVRRQGVVRGEA
ncbi:FAD:protein FMN transferase [Candidatus Woesearchaeota archaeon]|nr:MAG: FAD:protein FMN transferase [Candidatus Woesearchaeota archaeon]